VDARRVHVALADGTGLRALGDDQADARALAVVLDRDVLRDTVLVSAVAGQRRHDDAVGQRHLADLDGLEQ
jgi:hypothetical protein